MKDKVSDQLWSFLETIDLGMVCTDSQGTITGVNNVAVRMLSGKRDQLVGASLSDYLGEEWRGTVPVKNREEGTELWLNVDMKSDSAVSEGRLVMLQDVTGQVKAEQQLRSSEELHRLTLNSISDAVFITDDSGNFTFVCPNVNITFGYTDRELYNSGTISKLFNTNPFDHQHLENRGELRNIEITVPDKFGEPHDLLVNVKKVRVNGGSVLYSCRDVTELNRARRQIDHYQEQLRMLSMELSLAEERERRNIAGALHDGIGPNLALIKNRIESLGSTECGEKRARSVEDLQEIVDETIACTRSLVFELSPPVLYDLGFQPALEWLAGHMYRRYGLPVSVDTVQVLQKIAEPASIILFAVVRELLLNVVKHARATEANVRVCDENGILVISISDNGAGFAADPKNLQRLRGERFGLFSISERVGYLGGEFTIRSSPGAGTAAVIRIPAAKLSESCESNETCESKEEKSNGG